MLDWQIVENDRQIDALIRHWTGRGAVKIPEEQKQRACAVLLEFGSEGAVSDEWVDVSYKKVLCRGNDGDKYIGFGTPTRIQYYG